jgi:hypothetical protein
MVRGEGAVGSEQHMQRFYSSPKNTNGVKAEHKNLISRLWIIYSGRVRVAVTLYIR